MKFGLLWKWRRESDDNMKSANNHTIEVRKNIKLGAFPLFVTMAQRHLEKARPDSEKKGGVVVYPIAVDVLRLSMVSEEVLSNVASIEFAYRPK